MSCLNLAAYLFTPIEDPEAWIDPIKERAASLGLVGTVVLGREGINLTVAGSETAAREFTRWLVGLGPFAGLAPRESWSSAAPFRRLKVRSQDEIIRFGSEVHPESRRARSIPPELLETWLDQGRELVLLDARNRHEVERGTFTKAIHLDIGSFGELPGALDRLGPATRDRTVVTFCTGGIRCEKSALLMEERGFSDVYQLEGGILGYFEATGGTHFEGELFVFDDRVALDRSLRPVDESRDLAEEADS